MLDFTYNTPTRVYFGKDKHKEVGKIIKEYGFDTIMMQYGKNSIKANGLYDEVMASLTENGIKVVEFGGVEPNPKHTFVREAVKVAKENNVQLILAVGGGSVIDSCKFTALSAANDCDVWDIPTGKAEITKTIPVACILTMAAAGSEMSMSSVVTNMEVNEKRGYGNELNRCLFAIENPELTYTVSKYQTACGVVDIMMHTLERYFTTGPDTDLTDRISESIVKAVKDAGTVAINDPKNYEARATIMWGSSVSHNGLTNCGRSPYLAVHQLEHALSGEYDHVAHGAGLAVLYPVWCKYVYKENPARFAQLARRVWDVVEADDEKAALMGIEAMSEYFKSIGMPSKLGEFGISEDCIDRLVELCTFGGKRKINGYIELGEKELKEIFKMAF